MPEAVATTSSSLKQRAPAAATAAASNKTVGSTTEKKSPLLNSDEYEAAWKPPPFTLKDLRDCIPPELFQRSTFYSMAYVIMDFSFAGILFYLATYIDALPLPSLVKWLVLWPAYWYAQGVVLTGVWVLAHECGHQAFSDYAWVNNTVGYILHTFLLVPYYSWKISHSKHHKANAHMTKDQVFVPKTRSELGLSQTYHKTDDEIAFRAAPIYYLYKMISQQLFGWPVYLIVNATGQTYNGKWASHFHTTSPIFDGPKHATLVLLSDLGLIIAFGLIFIASQTFGFLAVVKYYLLPYLWVNHWLVMITFLQHTDVRVPHYREGEWDFLKGALSTVDRDFGILNFFHHHIADSHVAHHLFSTMPHYNALKATPYLKAKLGKYYIMDHTNIWVSLFRAHQTCRFVEDEGQVLWYKH